MSLFKKFLIGLLLLSNVGAGSVHAMNSEQVPYPIASEGTQTMFQNLKTQMMLSVFIIMRVNSVNDYDEKHWEMLSQESDECCLKFCIPTDENMRKHKESIEKRQLVWDEFKENNPLIWEELVDAKEAFLDEVYPKYPLNQAWTDLHYTKTLLAHLNELSDLRATSFIEQSAMNRQVVGEMAYDMFCALNSLWQPIELNESQNNLIDRLASTYCVSETFNGLEISMQDIELLLGMSKTLLLKLLDLKFLRTYPRDYETLEKDCLQYDGYVKRECFCMHYIMEHCPNLEFNFMGDILGWFRRETQDRSSEQVYDYVLSCLKNTST